MGSGKKPKNLRLAMVSQAFSPAAPIDDEELFADRPDQVSRCIEAVFQRGLHIALHGERGVGKTSLANVLPKIIQGLRLDSLGALRINCNSTDTYITVWRKIFRELEISIDDLDYGSLEPEDVRFKLQKLKGRRLIVIDELDRMEDDQGLSLLADTVKTLSDHSINCTLMLVGVADSLVNLIGEHESIARSLVQVQMPRMSMQELTSILEKGFARADLNADPEAVSRIIRLSEGLPQFTHLMGQSSGRACVEDDRLTVTCADVDSAMARAVDSHSLTDEYLAAVHSSQPGHLFEQVLLACSYAPRNELGYFRAGDLREPLSLIVGRKVDIPSFQRHLVELSGEGRKYTLQRDGKPKKYRYRFRNTPMQPYIKIRALAKGMISEEQRRELQEKQDQNSSMSNRTAQPDLGF